jgi:signal transduction histidine kinase/ActR/RegA family two-component response regulator
VREDRPTYEELESRLAHAEGVIEAIRRHEVDAVLGDQQVAYLRLQEVEDELQAKSEALRRLNEDLERQVAERTEVAEKRAALLQSMATDLLHAEQRERRRLSRLLHDHLQQLLSAAQIRAQMLESQLEADEGGAAAVELRNLLGEAVDASRSLAAELSPPALAHGLPAALRWLAEDSRMKHRLNVDLDVDEPARSCSEELNSFLVRSAQELLFNAVKHSGTDKARLTLSSGDDAVVLTVSDSGRGFDPSTLRPGGKVPPTGAGLLSIQKRLKLLGGRMEIFSAPGAGAEFRLYAPCDGSEQQASSQDVDLDVEPLPQQAQERPAPDPLTVLVVDDHDIFREGLTGMLAATANIEVVGEACDGETAVAMAKDLQPDVVVMDVSMPGISGIDATRLIRSEDPLVRIIGLSTHEDKDVARKMREAGAAAYITKGRSYEDLIAAIRGERGRNQAAE